MHAIGVRKFGKADKLEVLDVSKPEIVNADDILVNVKAVALNPGDGLRVPGYSRLIETIKLPFIIGHDYAGTVIAVGSAVTKFVPGDNVFGVTFAAGAAAEYLLLSSKIVYTIAKTPRSSSFVEASGLAAAAHTAIQSLARADTEIPGGLKGKTVFIPAGLGGVGSIALQVARKIYGVGKLITTVSSQKVDLVPKLLGPDVVDQIVDYTTQDVVKEIGKGTVDFMLDTIFVAFPYIAVLKPNSGVLFTITGKSGKSLAKDFPNAPWLLRKLLDVGDALFRWRAARWEVRYDHIHVVAHDANGDLETFAAWVDEGKVRAVIGRTEPMLDIEAVRDMFNIVASSKGGVGRLVIDLE